MADGKIQVIVDIISPGGAAKAKAPIKDFEKEVVTSQKRIEASSRATDRSIEASTKARTKAQTADIKASTAAFLSQLRDTEIKAKQSATRMSSDFSSAFKGGLVGGFVGVLAAQLAQLPSFFKSQLDQMVTIAAERQNAFKGLESIAAFKGISGSDAQEAVKSLRLVRAGVIDVTDATTGLKNLLATGFSLPQAVKLMEAFSDTAAFGKQAALSYGDAIRSATEGIKNGNSILVDNAGLTKNLSVILKEAGKSEKDLGLVTSDNAVRLALYNGILKEAQGQIGDADKLTQGWTGSTAAMTTATNNLYAAIGTQIIQSSSLLALIQTITQEINGQTSALQTNQNQSKQHTATLVDNFANISLQALLMGKKVSLTFELMGRALGLAVTAGIGVMTTAFFAIPNIINLTFVRPINVAIEGINSLVASAAGLSAIPGLGFLQGLSQARGISTIPEIPTPERGAFQMLKFQFEDFGGALKKANNEEKRIRQTFNDNLQKNLANVEASKPVTDLRSVKGDSPFVPKSPTAVNPALDTSGKTGGSRGRSSRDIYKPSPQAKAIIEAAERLGVSPIDLATIISYETGGTFSTTIRGGKGNKYRGLIQFGPEEYAKYKVGQNKGFGDQMQNSVVPFFQDRFRNVGRQTYGADILSLYKTVNAGNPNASVNASDRPGSTVATHVRDMIRVHTPKVLEKLFGGSAGNAGRDLPEEVTRALASPRIRSRADALKFVRSQTGGGIAGEITTPESDLSFDVQGHEAEIEAKEKLIEQNNRYKDVLDGLFDTQFNLNEQTELSTLNRKIELSLLPGLTEEQLKYVRALALETDTKIAKKKDDEEKLKALEDYRQKQQQVFEETQYFFENKIDTFLEGGFKGLWKSILDDMKRNFVKQFSTLLAQAFNPGAAQGGSGQQAGGGGLGSILGGLFGGGQSQGGGLGAIFGNIFGSRQGPGGTPNFNPNQAGATASPGGGGSMWGGWQASKDLGASLKPQGGGLGGMFGGLFGAKKNLLTGKMSKGGGIGGGIGMLASLAGSAIGGRFGGILEKAGMGAQIGSMFGPWGTAIGAGIGALVGIFGGSDDASKKLKEAAISQYGITVKDKNVLKQLKSIGEGYFGKGMAGKNAVATVKTDEGQNILRSYAEASGQSGLKIDRLNYGDENWKGNQFRGQFGGFREMGGPVQAGYSYVVGERRAEMFTPSTNGNISPTVGGGDTQMKVVLGQLEETVNMLATRLQSMSPGQVVSMGAAENPRAIRGAYEAEMAADGRATTARQRLDGLYR